MKVASQLSFLLAKEAFHIPFPFNRTGDVFVVGSGDCGQLGLGPDVLEKERPALLQYFRDKKIVAVYAGGLHNIALDSEGKVCAHKLLRWQKGR